MHPTLLSLLFSLSCLLTLSAQETLPVIPLPQQMERLEGAFILSTGTRIATAPEAEDFHGVAGQLAEFIREQSGLLLVPEAEGTTNYNTILFSKDSTISDREGYILDVRTYGIHIRAREASGAFYAVQTLRQLLPMAINAPNTGLSWTIPATHIVDAPRFPYRGMHLDVGRHYYPTDFIKKYIDLLAAYKINRFHWHLTEDQGWRIEINQYPRLQEIAAFRPETLVGHMEDTPRRYDGKRYGGFYTQNEIREIVRYAADRHITIIPEIEMPGHALAALAAYPELSCTGGPFEVAREWGVFEDVFCTKEATFTFLENVLTEVMALFPGEYIHIGGDECPKTRWKSCSHCQSVMAREGLRDEQELQSWFIRRIERFVNSKGRKIMGWDEILEGGLAPNAAVMSWRGVSGGIAAAKQGHPVVMTPTSHCYFDYYQSKNPGEPLAIGGYLPLEKVYAYEPVPEELSEQESRFILGAQGNVWTEYMPASHRVEYMAFPRAFALAELTWTSAALKNYDNFLQRLHVHLSRYQDKPLNYARSVYEIRTAVSREEGQAAALTLSTLRPGSIIRYTTDGIDPGNSDDIYAAPIPLLADMTIKAAVFDQFKSISPVFSMDYRHHLGVGANISLSQEPSKYYNLGGAEALINGVIGHPRQFDDHEWLGWSGKDLEIVIALDSIRTISQMDLRFHFSPGQWIYLPRALALAVSLDGQKYRTVYSNRKLPSETTGRVWTWPLTWKKKVSAQYIRLQVQRYGLIPPGKPGSGNEAWLFMDEIQLR
jgi:hexosaminidase